jgi:hypothetical protein
MAADGRIIHIADDRIPKQAALLPFRRDFEVAFDKMYLESAIDFMRHNPARSFVILPARKFPYYWLVDTASASAHHPLYWGPWAMLLPAFLIGIFFSLRNLRPFLLPYLLCFMSTATSMISFVPPRYRMVIEPFVLIVAVFGISRFVGSLRAARTFGARELR